MSEMEVLAVLVLDNLFVFFFSFCLCLFVCLKLFLLRIFLHYRPICRDHRFEGCYIFLRGDRFLFFFPIRNLFLGYSVHGW